QAVDYAANQGVDWVVLTNGLRWRVYNVTFAKPIDQELVIEIDFCALNPGSQIDLESLYLLCKEGWIKSVLGDYQLQKQALSRFFSVLSCLMNQCWTLFAGSCAEFHQTSGLRSIRLRLFCRMKC